MKEKGGGTQDAIGVWGVKVCQSLPLMQTHTLQLRMTYPTPFFCPDKQAKHSCITNLYIVCVCVFVCMCCERINVCASVVPQNVFTCKHL